MLRFYIFHFLKYGLLLCLVLYAILMGLEYKVFITFGFTENILFYNAIIAALPPIVIYSLLIAMQSPEKHISLTADERGIALETRHAALVLFWRGISAIREEAGYFVLKVDALHYLLPRKVFQGAGEAAQFKAFVQDMIKTHRGEG